MQEEISWVGKKARDQNKSVRVEPRRRDAFYIITIEKTEFHIDPGRLLDWTGRRRDYWHKIASIFLQWIINQSSIDSGVTVSVDEGDREEGVLQASERVRK